MGRLGRLGMEARLGRLSMEARLAISSDLFDVEAWLAVSSGLLDVEPCSAVSSGAFDVDARSAVSLGLFDVEGRSAVSSAFFCIFVRSSPSSEFSANRLDHGPFLQSSPRPEFQPTDWTVHLGGALHIFFSGKGEDFLTAKNQKRRRQLAAWPGSRTHGRTDKIGDIWKDTGRPKIEKP